MSTKKISELGVLLSVGLILSYLESLIPVAFPIPGIKLGLANIVTMYILYRYKAKEAILIMILRVLISGILFSGLTAIVFGILGGLLSIAFMLLAKKTGFFSIMGLSMVGAVMHNAGQILAAFIIMENAAVIYYLPYLLISGIISGLIVGYISAIIIKRLSRLKNDN